MAPDEQSEYLRELLTFWSRQPHLDCKALIEIPSDHALNPANMVEIGDHALAAKPLLQAQDGDPSRREVDRPAWILVTVPEHIAPGKRELDPLVTAALWVTTLCSQALIRHTLANNWQSLSTIHLQSISHQNHS
jgi:hypothetical protein